MAADADPGFAPAKVNLTLHLEGRRSDGYHLLRSLVVFADVGDRVSVSPDHALSLIIDGPFAANLSTTDNLILRAAQALARFHDLAPTGRLRLQKNLPVASGIGGGSSDAAAAVRVLARHWGVAVPPGLALSLGADVPVCLEGPEPRIMSGIGEILGPAPRMAPAWLVLVNPGVEVPTGAVFAGVKDRNPPSGPLVPAGGLASFDDLRHWLAQQRNDLQAPAIAICPQIATVMDALSSAPLSRMSGSGATCFGLFPSEASARATGEQLGRNRDWWVAVAPVCQAGG